MNQNVAATTATAADVASAATEALTQDAAAAVTAEASAAPAAKKAKAAKKTATKVAKPAKDKTATTVAVPRTDTKKFKAIEIVTAGLAASTARKDTLAKLQADLGLSASGANTYYQNVKAKKTGWTA